VKFRVGTFSAGASSFDTNLGETPSAILLFTTGSPANTIQQNSKVSIGASDGTTQWANSCTIEYVDPGLADDVVDFGTGRIIRVLNETTLTSEFDGTVTGFNGDGTVSMSWTGTPVGIVAFVAMSDCNAKCGSLSVPGTSGTSLTEAVGFRANCIIFCGTQGFTDTGIQFTAATRGQEDRKVSLANPVPAFSGAGASYYIAARSGPDRYFQFYSVGTAGVLFAQADGDRVAWTLNGPSAVSDTGFTLTRTVTEYSPVPTSSSGYLAIGKQDYLGHWAMTSASGACSACGQFGDINFSEQVYPRGIYRQRGYGSGTSDANSFEHGGAPGKNPVLYQVVGGFNYTHAEAPIGFPSPQKTVQWSAYDELGNQWSMVNFHLFRDQLFPDLAYSRAHRGLWNDRMGVQLNSDPPVVALSGVMEWDTNPVGGIVEPVITWTGTPQDVQFHHYTYFMEYPYGVVGL
jgi:hypothetical protein